MNIGSYIYAKLTADAAVTALVSDRIYPIYMPQNAVYPSIVYLADNTPHNNTKTAAADLDRTNVRCHIWAEGAQGQDAYTKLNQIEAAIRAALDYQEQITLGGVTVALCEYRGSKDGRNEEMTLFLREVNFEFVTRN